MDAQEFISYVKEPRELGKDSLADIEQLAADFPYCQSLRILHLLNMRMVNHVMYTEQLKATAAYIADRKRLKELIRGLKEEVPEAIGEIPESTDQVVTEEAILGEADTPVVISESEAVQHDTHEEGKEDLQAPDEEPILPIIEQDEEARLIALREIVENRLREISREKEEAIEEKEKTSKEALIDKFIREQPSISRPRAEFFDPVRVARSSQQEHEGIVSETLARIHLQQGNIEKAIEIYRKLSLNFPEKSSYFAAQIEKIKSEN